jgi:hypothetical protein
METQAHGSGRFSSVYGALRAKVVDGTFSPGSQIKVNEAAAELRTSTTPVREALSRLVGEELLEDRRRVGFFVPVPSAYELLDLFLLSELCLTAAVRGTAHSPRPRLPGQPPDPDGASRAQFECDPAAQVFSSLLERSNNYALMQTGARTLDRLAAARRAERLVFGREGEGVDAVLRHLPGGDPGHLVSALRAYHRLRRAHAEPLAFALARPAPGA